MKNKILFLAFDTFNKSGGIQSVSKTLCFTLNSIFNNSTTMFKAYSLNDVQPDNRYITDKNFFGMKSHRVKFIYNVIKEGIASKKIIVAHLHLIPILMVIKLINTETKVILLAHGTEFWRKINPILLNFIRKHVEIWAVSQFTKDSLIENHKLKKEKVIVVNNCIDPNFKIPDTLIKPKSLIDRYQLSPNQPILLTLCRIIGYEQPKGYDLVLNILPGLIEDFPKIHYFVSGKIDIQEKNRLEVLIRQLKIEEHVTLTGFISEKELTDHYLLADIFIMPSKKEGFGLVFIEAVSCGCKVIAGNQDGSVDALLNGKIGTLVNPDHPDEIKLALTHHLNCINQEKQLIINQKICIDHFGHEKYKEKIKSLLQ